MSELQLSEYWLDKQQNKYPEWTEFQSRTFKDSVGTIYKTWDKKFHCWDGPAIIHKNGKKEYYLYGMKYTNEDFKEAVRGRTGLPWYKQPAPKGTTHRN